MVGISSGSRKQGIEMKINPFSEQILLFEGTSGRGFGVVFLNVWLNQRVRANLSIWVVVERLFRGLTEC